jgi:hypothetical protein
MLPATDVTKDAGDEVRFYLGVLEGFGDRDVNFG